MSKRILATGLALVVCFMFSLNTFAMSAAVLDEADILTNEQEQTLINRIDDIRDTYNVDVTIVTATDIGGLHIGEYVEFHPSIDVNRDGIIFAQDVGARDYITIGRGYGESVMSDAALDRIDEIVIPYLSEDDYYGAYEAYLGLCVTFLDAAATGIPYEGEPRGTSDYLMAVAIGLVGGGLISFIVTGNMQSKMNTARKKREAASYVRRGSFVLGQSYDRFTYENTSRSKKSEKSSNSSKGGRSGGKY